MQYIREVSVYIEKQGKEWQYIFEIPALLSYEQGNPEWENSKLYILF